MPDRLEGASAFQLLLSLPRRNPEACRSPSQSHSQEGEFNPRWSFVLLTKEFEGVHSLLETLHLKSKELSQWVYG